MYKVIVSKDFYLLQLVVDTAIVFSEPNQATNFKKKH